jgi:hypothetical protein
VGDVEQAGVAAGGEMLPDDPGFVLDGHAPSAEGYHFRAMDGMPVMKNGFLKDVCVFPRHEIHLGKRSPPASKRQRTAKRGGRVMSWPAPLFVFLEQIQVDWNRQRRFVNPESL